MDALIVTADDFGLSVEVNEAVEAACREGVLTAASLMVSGPAAEDAVRRARRTPDLRVGLHVVLTDGAPTSPPGRIPALVDQTGGLRRDMARLAFAIAANAAAADQVEREIEAQFAAFAATGLELDHVNAHKHFHLHPLIGARLLSVGRRYRARAIRIPRENAAILREVEPSVHPRFTAQPWTGWLRAQARRSGMATNDWVFGLRWSGAMTTSRLAGVLERLPAGLVEVYTHPAVRNDFPGSAPGYRYAEELAGLLDPGCLEAVRRSYRPLGGYRDFV